MNVLPMTAMQLERATKQIPKDKRKYLRTERVRSRDGTTFFYLFRKEERQSGRHSKIPADVTTVFDLKTGGFRG